MGAAVSGPGRCRERAGNACVVASPPRASSGGEGRRGDEIYTTGKWKPNEGKEDAFVEAWADFAAWASTMSGAGTLRLTRDVRDAEVFLSFGAWESIDVVRTWKEAPEFRERLAHVLQHVDEFEPTELALVAAADAGAALVERAHAL